MVSNYLKVVQNSDAEEVTETEESVADIKAGTRAYRILGPRKQVGGYAGDQVEAIAMLRRADLDSLPRLEQST